MRPGLLPRGLPGPRTQNGLVSWTVADVMTKSVAVVRPDTDFKTCVRLLRANRISALPVVDQAGGQVLGIVSESDLLAKERGRGENPPFLGIRWQGGSTAEGRTAGDVMTTPAICIRPSAAIPEAARLMHREAVRRLPVIDANGKLIGIVTRTDLLKTFMRSDESIESDIVDNVLKKALFIDPKAVTVEVRDGLVRLGGELETKSLCDLVVRMVQRVEGTVGVESSLSYRLDDGRLRLEAPAGALRLSAQERSPR